MLRRSLLVVACVASGCATSTASGPSAPAAAAESTQAPKADARQELEALFKRELPPLKKVALTPEGGAFTGEVEAAGTPKVEKGDGYTQLSIPLGTATQLECFVYEQRINAGASLSGMLEHARKSVQMRTVRPTDVLVLKEAPAVVLDAVYTGEQRGQTVAGQFKLMVHADNSLPVLCLHDEPGYTETFKRVATGLMRSLEPTGDGFPTPRFNEVHVLRVQGQPVGFDWRSLYEGKAEGTTVDENISLMLVPQAADQLMANDSTIMAITDAKGQVVEMSHEEVNNGERELAISLERAKEKGKKGQSYTYEGLHSGKEVKGTFEAPRGLTTEMTMVRAVRERLLAGKAKELTFAVYSPEANPAAPVDIVYRRDAKTPTAITLQLGGVSLSATADAQGLFERYTMPLGSVTLEAERAFVRGTP